MQCKNNIKQYLLLFTHKNGNGYALVNATDPKVAENVFKAQTKYEDAGITSTKELRWFGQEMQLVEEGSVVTYGLSLYDLAVYNGYKGTLLEFMESMKGPKGDTGGQGILGPPGPPGRDGADGQDGTDGVGIVSITKTSTSGLVDTYTILLTNGTTTTFTVTNGSDATQVQSDWNESDNTSKAYIQNKPTIPTVPTNVSAFNNDAGYLNNNFCPIIEDTRSSAVAAITGVAPFSTLVDGQRIMLFLANYYNASNPTLTLTLSGGGQTSAIPIYAQTTGSNTRPQAATMAAGAYFEMVYISSSDRWQVVGKDTNTTYTTLSQATINAGTEASGRVITAALFHDNAYIVSLAYSSGSLKANKFYDFGTVSSALTIPSLDATNDLVSNALNFYALRFVAGADNLSITFPTGVIVDDEPTINTGDYVEIMINKYGTNYYASIKVWQAQ